MSRSYEMTVEIVGRTKDKLEPITKALGELWHWDSDWWERERTNQDGSHDVWLLSNYGQSQLCGGETEEEFADRVAKAVWEANNGYCEVSVRATYLEELPFEDHGRDEDDYERLMGRKQ